MVLPGHVALAQTTHDIAQQMAPTGTLRAVINLGNPILARLVSNGLEPEGVSVDLARALAETLQVPLQLVPVNAAAQSVQAVRQGQADIGFFAIDPVRGQGIAFTPPYVLIEGSYLVKKDSPLIDNAQVDQRSHRVVVGRGSAYDLFLTRELKSAQLVRAPTSPQVVPFFLNGPFDVAAGVKQQLESDAQKFADLRLLPGHFMVIEQAMGQASDTTPAAKEFLNQFVVRMKLSGFVRQSLLRHQIEGAIIAP
ncbi:transporter substrate-binding domain-containing protein [Limnohabitans sp. Jir72]|uniref:transporter substrate-binding domain-containing protein n=1 Tax=Limnohabitans sp. Jir72 TaxID=1977909 RepID=UPI000D3A6BB8|nr:transporter substrate-binding domain-containing protein [Limnohabitans sp. Jir72]PUE33451.1 ABC transporter substrate-binding protein [Limnohabitans sp. Jir72]